MNSLFKPLLTGDAILTQAQRQAVVKVIFSGNRSICRLIAEGGINALPSDIEITEEMQKRLEQPRKDFVEESEIILAPQNRENYIDEFFNGGLFKPQQQIDLLEILSQEVQTIRDIANTGACPGYLRKLLPEAEAAVLRILKTELEVEIAPQAHRPPHSSPATEKRRVMDILQLRKGAEEEVSKLINDLSPQAREQLINPAGGAYGSFSGPGEGKGFHNPYLTPII